ncbi:MAG: hypothetical protein SVX43_10965 [Cyanobacteriota bacterium]|nr:hypothetical protein [Cyanobacteriota bacterium]
MTSATVPRPRVTVYFDEEILDALTEWASEETRTVGNLVEHLAIRALKEREKSQVEQDKHPKPDLEIELPETPK